VDGTADDIGNWQSASESGKAQERRD